MSAQSSHAVATETAHEFFRRAGDERLSQTDTLIACETFLAIAVAYVAAADKSMPAGSKRRYAQELIDSMTQAAHGRVLQYLKAPGDG